MPTPTRMTSSNTTLVSSHPRIWPRTLKAPPRGRSFPRQNLLPLSHTEENPKSPKTIITAWTTEECASFIASLGLRQYCQAFLENGIMGDALIALRHDELKEMGIASVGHRLTILKSVYEMKVKQDIPIDADHYIPLSADQSMNESASQEDIARLIQSIRLRDERIVSVEAELRRVIEDYRRLREELLPVFKMAKDRSQPLPPPTAVPSSDNYHDTALSGQTLTGQSQPSGITILDRSGSIIRSLSKRVHGGTTPKNHSPTHIPPSIHEGRYDGGNLDPSAAAVVASSHLSTMNGKSQLSPNLPSPTSPGNLYGSHQMLASRTYTQPASTRSLHDHHDDNQSSSRTNPTPTSASRDIPSRSESRAGGDTPSVEIFKSFRVSVDDPCYKVLPAALKKYNINGDWKQYALYIVYGDQERCLGLEERPLILFKQLEKEGRKPMFMLRKQQQVSDSNANPYPSAGGSAPNSAGFEGRGQAQINLPGGVL
ncbi:hypothetical protein BJX61DRAFT_102588 [Aspergillus egyptiacus]|nr:hypothetical protein BJX61DRAFT_102588 [Aspergillus egyptiacus]